MKKVLSAALSAMMLILACTGCSSGSIQKGDEYVSESDAVSNVSVEESSVTESATDEVSVEEAVIDVSTEEASTESLEDVVETDSDSDTIVFIGDSQFANARDEASSIPSLVSLITGANVYDLAIGGTTAAITNSDSYEVGTTISNTFLNIANAIAGKTTTDTITDSYVASQILQMNPANVDYYVIEYGYNDFISKVPQSDNDSAYDVHLYVDSLCLGINTLKEVSPNAQFILCGPSYCLVYDNSGQYLGDGNIADLGYGTLADYASSCEGAANGLGITYIDTYYGSEFDLSAYSVDDYTEDGLHFNEVGRQIYATVISHYINKLRYGNVEEMDVIQLSKFTFEYY